jgi:hypothetical protein
MTNATQRAIEDAVKGGYAGWDEVDQRWFYDMYHRYGTQWCNDLKHSAILLYPDFWRALGKQRGWETKDPNGYDFTLRDEWKLKWHSIIDHLVSGRDIESFFAELEKQQLSTDND